MTRSKPWKWEAHAMGKAHDRRAGDPVLVLKDEGSAFDGDTLYSLSDSEGGAPCLTSAQWQNLCIELMSESPIRECK